MVARKFEALSNVVERSEILDEVCSQGDLGRGAWDNVDLEGINNGDDSVRSGGTTVVGDNGREEVKLASAEGTTAI